MARYPARNAVMYVSTTRAGAASAVLGVSEITVNQEQEKIEVTAFGDANKIYVPGLADLSGDYSGFWDDTESKLFAAARSLDGCNLYLYPSSAAPTKFWSGPAWLNVSMDMSVAGAVQISGDFSAAGSWTNTF
jgi:hypothetical protein